MIIDRLLFESVTNPMQADFLDAEPTNCSLNSAGVASSFLEPFLKWGSIFTFHGTLLLAFSFAFEDVVDVTSIFLFGSELSSSLRLFKSFVSSGLL